ncbi:TATA-binding protein [Orobanche hederae]
MAAFFAARSTHKEELQRRNLELDSFRAKIEENQEKIKLNKQLPYLIGNIVECHSSTTGDESEDSDQEDDDHEDDDSRGG